MFFILYFAFKYKNAFDLLRKLEYTNIGLLMVITMGMAYIQSLQFFKISRTLKKDVSWKNILAITFISTLYNNILPVGGAVAIRTSLLKRVTGIAWSEVTGLMSVYYMISYLSMSLFLLATALIAYQLSYIELIILIPILLICTSVIALILFLFISTYNFSYQNRLITFLNRLLKTIRLYKYKLKDHFEISFQQILIIFLTTVRLYLSFIFLDISIDFWKLILVQSFISYSLVFSITPGNLGLKEGLIVLTSSFLVIDEDVALVGSLVDRGAGLLSILLLGTMGKLWLFFNIK